MYNTTTNSFTSFHCANQFWRVIRACLIVGESDGRKTTLIRDSINCCHRHEVSSFAPVSLTVNLRRPASQRLLKWQTQEFLTSRMSNAPEFYEFAEGTMTCKHAATCHIQYTIWYGWLSSTPFSVQGRSLFIVTEACTVSAAVGLVIIVLRPKHVRGKNLKYRRSTIRHGVVRYRTRTLNNSAPI